jgi:hypothetical protein
VLKQQRNDILKPIDRPDLMLAGQGRKRRYLTAQAPEAHAQRLKLKILKILSGYVLHRMPGVTEILRGPGREPLDVLGFHC